MNIVADQAVTTGPVPADDAYVTEQRAWMMAYKAEQNIGWEPLSRVLGIPTSTVQAFGKGTYSGVNRNVAEKIEKFRHTQASVQEIESKMHAKPGWLQTPTAKKIDATLRWAHQGRITVFVGGPGIGKTMTAEEYAKSHGQALVITMRPSTAGVANMQQAVLTALGQRDAVGTPQKMTQLILERVRGGQWLLIFDEAQELTEKSTNEIRGWFDEVEKQPHSSLGIAFLGNHEVVGRMQGGARRPAFAQFSSRVSWANAQALPTPADTALLLDAWGIEDAATRQYLTKESQQPGGLRTITQALERAAFVAEHMGEPLTRDLVRQAVVDQRTVLG